MSQLTEGAPFAFLIDLNILSGLLEPIDADLTFSTKLSIVVSAIDSRTNVLVEILPAQGLFG